jgi:hypothetical protein
VAARVRARTRVANETDDTPGNEASTSQAVAGSSHVAADVITAPILLTLTHFLDQEAEYASDDFDEEEESNRPKKKQKAAAKASQASGSKTKKQSRRKASEADDSEDDTYRALAGDRAPGEPFDPSKRPANGSLEPCAVCDKDFPFVSGYCLNPKPVTDCTRLVILYHRKTVTAGYVMFVPKRAD